MSAFVLILAAIASRFAALSGWFNFTAVGGSLLYFGARRPLRQAAWALVPFMAMDVYLTTRVYGMAFHAQDYLVTWLWYAAVLVLGSLLLKQRTNITRVVSGSMLASTSFFAVSNYAVWVGSVHVPAHARWTHRLLRGRPALLPQRSRLHSARDRRSLRRGSAGPPRARSKRPWPRPHRSLSPASTQQIERARPPAAPFLSLPLSRTPPSPLPPTPPRSPS